MFDVRMVRKTRPRSVLVCAGLLAFLLARAFLPHFARATCHGSVVRYRVQHDHSKYFDHEPPDVVVPAARAFLPGLVTLPSPSLSPAPDPFTQAASLGVQYKRPPPAA
jgi:hypothetical protein